MKFPVPTEVLRHAREAAQIRQSALAVLLGTNATFVSRLEKEPFADAEFARRYLEKLDTDLAREIIAYYERDWTVHEPPSFLHPDREPLWRAEVALRDLGEFESGPKNRPVLQNWIASMRDDLTSVVRYLERLDHTIAWVGDIGVGKTTAIAYATKLFHTDGKGAPKPVFPVGTGRITVAEYKIKGSPAYGVAVEPLDNDAIRALVSDLVGGYVNGGKGGGVSTEMMRVLRNMSGFRTRRIAKGEEFETIDPIVEALAQKEAPAALVDRVVEAMDLNSRRETSDAYSGDAEDGMSWLARTIAGINSGSDERFSVPRRVTVLLPSPVLRAAGELSVVDTKGIEATTQRRDIRDYQDDPRAVMIICSRFPDAPGQTAERLLHDQREQGSNAVERGRVALLVLPQRDEPMHVMDSGEPPSSEAEGRAIRREQIESSLSGLDLPIVPVMFFDAHRDAPEKIWSQLRDRVSAMRGYHVGRLDRAARAVAELISNVDVVAARGAREDIEERFGRLEKHLTDLGSFRRAAHINLVEQLGVAHPSSVAASVARRGNWDNFPIQHFLGVGVRQDAHLRTMAHFNRIQHATEDMADELGEIVGVRDMLATLTDSVEGWRQDFLGAALEIGSDVYRKTLEDEFELWREARDRYGTYEPGYKRDVGKIFTAFFEESATDEHRRAIESRLLDAWRNIVLDPLKSATRAVKGELESSAE